MNKNILSLSKALVMIFEEHIPPHHAIYLRKDEYPWDKDSPYMIFDLTQLDNDDEDPPQAKQHRFTYVLTAEQVYGVIDSANSQLQVASVDKFVKAFNYYYRNDAFIKF